MSKTFKSIVAAAAAALTVGVFSIGAAAAAPYGTMDFRDFRLIVPDYNGTNETDPEEKTDYYKYAVVYLEEGSTVSEETPLRMRVYKVGQGSAATSIETATEKTRYVLEYKDGSGEFGAEYYLFFSTGRYGVTADGRWAP